MSANAKKLNQNRSLLCKRRALKCAWRSEEMLMIGLTYLDIRRYTYITGNAIIHQMLTNMYVLFEWEKLCKYVQVMFRWFEKMFRKLNETWSVDKQRINFKQKACYAVTRPKFSLRHAYKHNKKPNQMIKALYSIDNEIFGRYIGLIILRNRRKSRCRKGNRNEQKIHGKTKELKFIFNCPASLDSTL